MVTWKPNEILVIRIFCQLFNEFPVEYWYFVWMINEPRARRNGLATRPFFPLNRLEYFFSKPPWNSICHFYPSVFRVHVKSYWLIEIQKVTLCIISIFVHYFPLRKWYFSIENCTKKDLRSVKTVHLIIPSLSRKHSKIAIVGYNGGKGIAPRQICSG